MKNYDEQILIRIEGGYIRAIPSQDPDYPGIWVELIRDDEPDGTVSRPQILFEQPKYQGYKSGEARILIWEDPDDEDYTQEIEFKKEV